VKPDVIDQASKAHTVTRFAQVVILAWVACVVAVSGANQVMVATVSACPVKSQVNPQVAVAVHSAIVHPANVKALAECVRVTSAVDGAVLQVITLVFHMYKSFHHIAAVPRSSVLSVSDTKVVLIATEARSSRALLAHAAHEPQLKTQSQAASVNTSQAQATASGSVRV